MAQVLQSYVTLKIFLYNIEHIVLFDLYLVGIIMLLLRSFTTITL